jgi:putative SbcD/Mre11-related phosphoesterase
MQADSLILPIYNTPLLLVEGSERVLVAADLHLGLEYELWLGGVSIPSQTGKILERLLRSLHEIKPDRLLLLGDVKHNVPRTSWQERKEIPCFLESLSKKAKVEIVLGNHDSDLASMAPAGVRVRPSSGFVLDDVGYFHGHTWPDEKILGADLLVAAHLHPAVRLKDPLGYSITRRIWARTNLLPHAVVKQYGFASTAEIIIAPAFNDLCGGLPLNEPCDEARGPIPTLVDLSSARIYLMDGTNLGTVREVAAAQRNASDREFSPA